MSEVCRVRAPSGALPPLAGDEDGRVVLFSGPRATAIATIANGGTTSGAVDLTTTALLGFIAPGAWTTATLKLQGSPDGAAWSDILDPDGAAVSSYAAVTAGAAYSIDVAAMLPYRYVRFVAGAAQGADRTFTVITRPLA